MAGQMKYKDQSLRYQPFHDVLRKFDTVCKSKNIQSPFSEKGFEDVLQMETVRDSFVTGLASTFVNSTGTEDAKPYKDAFESCVRHAFQEHSNPFSQYSDVQGNQVNFGAEGYGATAITGNYNTWTRLAPVLTAGYLARSRALELYQIINDDKPTFWREYSVVYTQKGLDGEQLVLPKAIRSGEIAGMTDLPLCNPVPKTVNADNWNIEEKTTDAGKKINMVKVGTTGNLMDQSQFEDGTPVDKTKHALERQCSIDYVGVKVDGTEKIIHTRIERDIKTGKTSERMFNSVVKVQYEKDGKPATKVVRVSALIDLDTGNYQVLSDGTSDVTFIHFNVRVTNVANEMKTYMNGQYNYVLSFDIENKIYGSIPVIPEMMADYNTGGEGVSWVAYMTDQMTETYSGIRDLDLENFVDSEYEYSAKDFELAFKLGGFKYTGTYPLIPRHPGGSDDILAPQRMAMKQYLSRVFKRSEKYVNFDRDIARQWILMANDEDVDILPDVSWTSSTAEMTGGEGENNFRYGFSLDDAYGYMDNFGRKVRVIGSKDERWLGRPIWAIQKSLTLAAPTTIYFPYMFRVFSSISPDMRNRPAMLFASRDAKRISTMVQARITLEGNDLNLMSNAAAFAAGYTADNKFTPPYDTEGVKEIGQADAYAQENIPNYVEKPVDEPAGGGAGGNG